MDFGEKRVKCGCGKELGGTYIKRMGYIFECHCGRTHRGGLWLRTVIYGLLENYEGYSRFRMIMNRTLRSPSNGSGIYEDQVLSRLARKSGGIGSWKMKGARK